MARQDANDLFAQTSFLYGGNAAYIEELYARYQQNPASVDAEWQTFFAGLKDDAALITKNSAICSTASEFFLMVAPRAVPRGSPRVAASEYREPRAARSSRGRRPFR